MQRQILLGEYPHDVFYDVETIDEESEDGEIPITPKSHEHRK